MLVKRSRKNELFAFFLRRPAVLIMSSFLAVIMIGVILLSLPVATYDPANFTFLDALFTSVSATCVTGLVVGDTATTFTLFGQVVILILIQIGGLGLVTITTFFISLLSRRIGQSTRNLALESSGSFTYSELNKLLKAIVFVTLGFEVAGGAWLSYYYVPMFGKIGIFKAFFQTVSAFCNGGFDVLGDVVDTSNGGSLIFFTNNVPVLMITAIMIMAGSLGFIVWVDIFSIPFGGNFRTQSKILIKWSVILIILGMFFILLFDWNNEEIIGHTVSHKLLSAFFQSVSFRTAGFASVDQAKLSSASKTLGCFLMFIGAGAGSTGGGIKITTFAVLLATVSSELSGKDAEIEKRHITSHLIRRSLTITVVGICTVMLLSILLSISEAEALAAGNFDFLDIVYEACSAFATVGLSTAGTPDFTCMGQAFIIPVMFMGRIGPLTLGMIILKRDRSGLSEVLPDAKINIG